MAGLIIHQNRWRLYFNSRQAAPLVCSLDNGDTGTEFSVRQAILHDIKHVYTTYLQESERERQSDDRQSDPARVPRIPRIPSLDGPPIFCVEFEGYLEMEFGIAHFWPCKQAATMTMGEIGR